ncbi:hypothetical protein [Streptococcus sobrinus]|uniref:hypothetical protein n=1 Tax=Streptococcus sobrinus TaxID=1310 RepID=UPI0002E33276|nr:hypothetical protein [Streptococcus sobrinus]
MNEIKKAFDTEVSISDLRQLGKSGNATARLDSGEIVDLKPKYGLRKKTALIDDQEVEVQVIDYYPKIYKHIRTIKRRNLIIARKVRRGNQFILQLTGKGYHRS